MSKQSDLVTVARDAGASGYVNVAGDTMTGNLTVPESVRFFTDGVSGTQRNGRISGTASNVNPYAGGVKLEYYNFDGSSYRFYDGVIVDGAGRVTMPYQPSFFARMPAGEVALASGLTLLTSTHLGAVDYNVGGHYNTSTATFTAPISGLYHFDIGVYVYPVSQCDVYVQVNNADFHRFHSQPFPSAVNPNGTRGSTNFGLAANDTVRIVLAVSASCGLWNGGPRATYFSGYLIG